MFLHFIVLLGKVMGQQMRKSWRRDVRKLWWTVIMHCLLSAQKHSVLV
jgi:hypothetical protein